MLHFIITLLAGMAFGYLLYRLKVPGGMMVGSIIGVLILNIFSGAAYMPAQAKTFAQITAGAFIGCTVEKSDLKRLRYILKPALIMLSIYLVLNLYTGFVIHSVSSLDWATSFMCCTPGGISDIPLISVDMGANPAKVVALQFVRLVFGIGVFPTMINMIAKDEVQGEAAPGEIRERSGEKSGKIFLVTMLAALAAGWLGQWLGVQAGALVFSLFSVIALKLLCGAAYLPPWMKRLAQVLSGAYIGCSMGLGDLLELRHLALPALLLILHYGIACICTGRLLKRFCGMTLKEGMLVATPAGASDMALISSDMGVQSTDIVVLQVIRLVVVISVFPQIISLILKYVI